MTAILKRVQVGNVGDAPGKLLLNTTNTLAQVTVAGFLNTIAPSNAVSIYPSDIIEAYMADGTAIFYPSFGVNNEITLVDITTPGSVVTGAANLGGTGLFTSVASNLIQLKGLTAGTGIAFGVSGTAITISASGYPTYADITAGQAALASAGKVNLIVHSSVTAQYKVRTLQLNLTGTNFSGGGGDRLLAVTDGTHVYSVIPAATLQTLANAQWGVTALPNPASVSINVSTTAGADLYLQYSGGTTDYTAGSLTVTIGYQQVTA